MDNLGLPPILFVCTANQCRSPIAAATYQKVMAAKNPAEKISVASAGTWTKTGLPIGAASLVLAEQVGINLKGFKTTSVDDLDLAAYQWIVVMEKGHKEALCFEHPNLKQRIHLLTTLAGAPAADIDDPIRFDLLKATQILSQMQAHVDTFVQRLLRGDKLP